MSFSPVRIVSRGGPPFLVLLITFTTLWFWFPGKVIYDIIIALALGAFVTAFLRPDLILSMLARALSFTVLYIALIQFLLAMYPTFVQRYYNAPNLLGIYVLGVPVEQVLFAAASGAIWSVAYEYIQSYRSLGWRVA